MPKRSARSTKFAVSNNSNSSVLRFLKVVFLSDATGSPNRAAVPEISLQNTRVEDFKEASGR